MPSKFWKYCRMIARVGILPAALILLSGASTKVEAAAPSSSPEAARVPAPGTYRPGRIIVTPKRGKEADLRRFHQGRRDRVRRSFAALGDAQVIELEPGADTAGSLEAYRKSGLVDSAEPDILFRPAVIPNDPTIQNGDQWGLHNTGFAGGLPDADIDAPEAWDRLNSASNIVVAIIDSGARLTHEDLAANLWVNPGEIAGNGRDDDGNGIIDDVHGINSVTDVGVPTDDLGHGTHVAGIVGAVGNNGLGVCGVAWRVQIMPLRFLSPGQLGTLSDLLQCLNYAQNKGARVVNCSFTTTTYSPSMSNAFWSLREAGVVVAAAAGNDGTDNDLIPNYPASLKIDNIVSVTATTRTDAFSRYNYGANSVHLGAPGTSIWSTYNRSDADYVLETGTSMASPHVAGALALLRARYPSLTPAQLIARLLASVDPLPELAGRCLSGGRLNLDKALGPRDYNASAATFAWVPTNGLAPLALDGNGVSPALPLKFSFAYYGRVQTNVYVSANGILGFDPTGLGAFADSALPSPAVNPNGAIYPYWDDLNPAGGGSIWQGTLGVAPNRKFVVSWIDVPHNIVLGGESLFTFQTVLHESGEMTFQYLDLTNGRPTLVSGRSASVGVEDYTGTVGLSYLFHTASLTNSQAIVLATGGSAAIPSLDAAERAAGGQLHFRIFGSPGQTYILSASADARAWVPAATNALPASGIWELAWPTSEGARFFRARAGP